MNLVTTCPRCRTSFCVVTDQLRLRGGLVRCGACDAVFSGLDALRRPQEPRESGATPSAVRFGGPEGSRAAFARHSAPGTDTLDAGPEDYAPSRAGIDNGVVFAAGSDTATMPVLAPLGHTDEDDDTGEDGHTGEDDYISEDDHIGEDERDVQVGRAVRGDGNPDDHEDRDEHGDQHDRHDDLVGDGHGADEARLLPGVSPRGSDARDASRILQLAAVVILATVLPLQLVIGDRDWLAARFPALEPTIQSLVAPLGLAIEAPRSLDTLSIQSFDLRPATQPGVYSVSAILRNDASHEVRWPSMLLTLTDGADQVLVRRIIDPAEYLGGDRQTMELRGRSERQLRFALEGDTLQARRSSVALFYR